MMSDKMNNFEIPVVVFFFTRDDLILQVIDRISKVKPQKIYLFSDGGRNPEEHKKVLDCRKKVEKALNRECEVIKNYAEKNRGVYESIGKGAQWVFEHEEKAIFLEDDNLPELSFFRYCKELLELYENDDRILWICGTNYLESFEPSDGSSYMFTKHLLPCGWASWSNKFLRYYDGELNGLEEPGIEEKIKYSYENKALFKQQIYNFNGTYYKLRNNKDVSWDYQMCFSLRANSVYGISPKKNQIKNIGVDERSTHGGTSLKKVMTRRFCGMGSKELEFPLKHPKFVIVDNEYESRISNIILQPLSMRIIYSIVRKIKPLLGFEKYESVSLRAIKEKVKK